jgi:hypothetical protein
MSPTKHLAYAIWSNHDPRRRFLAHFTAYFDASGHPDHKNPNLPPAFFVSGFVASVEKWLKFERKWLSLLAEYEIAPPFHMKDFEAGVGQYAPWKDDKPRRDEFRGKAIDVIRLNTNKPMSVGLVLPDFYRWFQEYEIPDTLPREPYVWCGLAMHDRVQTWARNRIKAGAIRLTDKIEFVFETGDKHRGRLADEFEKQTGRPPIFRRKDEAVAFQACDFLAWENRRWLTDRQNPKWRGPRPSSVYLHRHVPSDYGGFVTWETLSRDAEKHGWPRRQIG